MDFNDEVVFEVDTQYEWVRFPDYPAFRLHSLLFKKVSWWSYECGKRK